MNILKRLQSVVIGTALKKFSFVSGVLGGRVTTPRLFKVLTFLFLTGLVAGCKVAVIVVEGGDVQSTGSGTCAAGTICIIEVNDTNFSETFTAIPNTGWYFRKWNSGEGFLCADSTDPTCTVSSVGTAGNTYFEALIASSETFYLMPIFGMGNPITETVTVDGKEWAQVDLFTNLSWNDISAVCSADTGRCAGELNGYDMTGWTWASGDNVRLLFQAYEEAGKPIHHDFGQTLRDKSFYILAIVRDRPDIEGAITVARITSGNNNTLDFLNVPPEDNYSIVGAWFWRSID